MKTVIKALLAATTLLPAAAYAQNATWQNRGDQGETRADRDGDGTTRGGQRGQWRNRVDTQPQAQARLQAEVQAQPTVVQPDDRRDHQHRRGDANRGGYQGRVEQPQAYQAPTYRTPTDQNRWGDQRRRGEVQRADNGADAVQRYQNSRRDIARGRQDRRDDRDTAQRYGNRYGTRSDNRGTWNRDWRGDHRYNYNSYRTSNRGAYRLPRYYAPSNWGYGYRRFSIGVTLSSFLWDQNYWIDDPYAYRLPEAYGPYRWVRYYDDALLIDIRSGRVVDSVYGIFY
ncbi:RcnB family protein [Sphingomonas oligophenolica]|uniref:ATP-dependent RNA helicase n=1 Tax=Sphingomonas oligophenolica TaxID=301154 RepID=A0A502CHF4_9SPHN|nr:RcnB family protein [Sphingomonas oligophenolica]TPG12617.1 hypothetical protein EAH84_07440 [Sphingomonas oligophenolica]